MKYIKNIKLKKKIYYLLYSRHRKQQIIQSLLKMNKIKINKTILNQK